MNIFQIHIAMKSMRFKQMKRVFCLSGLFSLLVLALLHGCVPKEDEIIVPDITPSVEEFKVDASGGTFTIDIESNVTWSIIGGFSDWYEISKINDQTLSVVIDENTTARDRKASIVLEAQGSVVKIPVIQREKVEISLDNHEINLNALPTDIQIEVESNYAEWLVTSSEAWLRATKEQNKYINLVAKENKSTEKARKAIVTISADGKEEKIEVKQDFATIIKLSRSSILFPWKGGEEWIEVESNKEVMIEESLLPSIFTVTVENKSLNSKRLHLKMRRYDEERQLNCNLYVSANDISIPISVSVEPSMFRKNQMEALKAFYKATDGDNWTRNDNWLSDKPITEWYGIIGEDSQVREKEPTLSVVVLKLNNNNLVGELPKEIGLLDDLMVLELSDNHLYGTVPEELSDISNLYKLDLSNNEYSGTIPSFLFSDLLTTRTLKLNNNNFEGYIDLDKLVSPEVHLSRIELQMNKLRGPRPKQVKERVKIIIDPQQENYGFED